MEKDFVWLSASGCVKGVPVDWLNGKIDEYNRSRFLRSTGDFWGWLSWEEGEEFRGFAWFTNDTSKLHRIKGV